MLPDAHSHIPTWVGTVCSNLISLEGKPTTGEGLRVRNLFPLPLHHVGLDELVPEVRGLHVQARSVSKWVVLLTVNCPSDSAGRAPYGPPTLVQQEALRHLTSSVAIFFGRFSGKL